MNGLYAYLLAHIFLLLLLWRISLIIELPFSFWAGGVREKLTGWELYGHRQARMGGTGGGFAVSLREVAGKYGISAWDECLVSQVFSS